MRAVKAGLSRKVNGVRRLKGVLFDKDGTLIDLQLTWGPAIHAAIHALAEGDAAKLRAQAEILHFDIDAQRFHATSPIVSGATAQYGAAWAVALGRTDFPALRLEIDEICAVECLRSLTAIGDPVAVVDALRGQGLKLGLATNDAEASARRHLDQLGLSGRMDFICGYDTGHGAKPGPGMVEAFARAIGASPSEVALVGDSLHDLDSARAAGAVAVAVLSGIATRGDLAPHADYVLADVSELPAWAENFTLQ
jgi:phosphoglycolate phosphatase